MYAIVDIAGQQFKVEKDQQLFVHRLEGDEGAKVDFDKVLLIDNKGKVNVGTPIIQGAQVSAKIVRHLKGDKVIVFKKKRRKGYQKKNGHRQYLSEIVIEGIAEKGGKKAAAKLAEPKKEAAPKVEAKKAEKPKAETTAKKPAAKAATKPKTEAKPKAEAKPAAKKETKPKVEKKAAPKKAAPKKTEAKKAAPKAKKEDKDDK